MSKMFLLTGSNFYLTVASVRIKALAVFVVLCIFANALVPKFALDAKDYSTFCQIMKSQSALFEFFSFSTLPIKIVNELFNEQRGASAASQRKAPRDNSSNASNTSSDFSITGAAFADVSRFLTQRGADFGGGNALAVFAGNLSVLPGAGSGNPPVIPLIIFILLMFYFLKARSALPDAAIIMPVWQQIIPIRRGEPGFFFVFHVNGQSKLCSYNSTYQQHGLPFCSCKACFAAVDPIFKGEFYETL